MKLPDALLRTLALSASALLLPPPAGDTAMAFDAESGKVVVAADIPAASKATPTPEPVHGCEACGMG